MHQLGCYLSNNLLYFQGASCVYPQQRQYSLATNYDAENKYSQAGQ